MKLSDVVKKVNDNDSYMDAQLEINGVADCYRLFKRAYSCEYNKHVDALVIKTDNDSSVIALYDASKYDICEVEDPEFEKILISKDNVKLHLIFV